MIIGGGQGGIGARRAAEAPGRADDHHREERARPATPGASATRSLCLHDPVWYDHLPYLPFPDHWPVFSPKDKIGDWLEMYTKVMELNYWRSTECKSAQLRRGARRSGRSTVERDGETVVLRPKQLVLATGMSGDAEHARRSPAPRRFQGEQHHSSQHPGGEDYRGKKCVVLGSNNSAHDICADLWEHGADVTMIQRSSTHVARSRHADGAGARRPVFRGGGARPASPPTRPT